jgi:hypothetical protein
MKIQRQAEILSDQTFLGFPSADFEKAGREQLIYLLSAGLSLDSKVVDLGCGVLRAGYWLIHVLDPDCYCGIEPHTGRLEMGVNTILEPEVLRAKRPRFDTNPHFDTSVFKEKFDFFLAYSIWTHASKQQIEVMLDSFLRDSTNEGIFLTSYLPAGVSQPDYMGDRWNGTSHESDVQGCIYHSLAWIETECESRGLVVLGLGTDQCYGQSWLRIVRGNSI